MEITYHSIDELDPEETHDVFLEPLPPHLDEQRYIQQVRGLPTPTLDQIADFVGFVSEAKSWYKHLPACPPGSPIYFYLDPHAGQDRLRRWGHRVIYRDRTATTDSIHYTWMTTADYRSRFGYLAFCSPHVTTIWTDEQLADGVATLDSNVSEPLVEGDSGRLVQVPETVLEAGRVMVTRTVHPRTDASCIWKRWNREVAEIALCAESETEPLSATFAGMAALCQALAEDGVRGRRLKKMKAQLDVLIAKQRCADHERMTAAIQAMLGFVRPLAGHLN
jgi:hypothetical protein